MSVIRSAIRGQVYALLHQTSSDTTFSDTQINDWINEAQSLVASIITWPRKRNTTTVALANTATYALPTDWVQTLKVYFGNVAVAGDIQELEIVTEDYLASVAPGWLETTTQSQGRPRYFVVIDKTNFLVYPTPDSANVGKAFNHSYIYEPAALTSDSDTPSMPQPYQNILKFYVLHLAFIANNNKDFATAMFNDFMAHHKQIQADANKEAKQSLQWVWVDRVGLDVGGDSVGESLQL